MFDLKSKLSQIEKSFDEDLSSLNTIENIDDLLNKYLGRKNGLLNNFLKELKNLSVDEKKTYGPLANKLRIKIEKFIKEKKDEFKKKLIEESLVKEKLDLSLDLNKINLGHKHPNTIVQEEIEDIFKSMGFLVLDGPELESEFYNFDALNIAETHPAREDQDTFWLDNNFLLRSQTSSVQVRAMKKYGAPLRVIVPGRVFRNENLDASHEHTFYQLEGMMIGENISVANLMAVMNLLLSKLFNDDNIVLRSRPGYFPFVEPGIELDMQCNICSGRGCSVCKQSGWIEVLPCGMIHPNVLKAGGLDPDIYSGFAFGLGLSRMVMMKYNIDNIRLLQSGDLRFLNQF